MKFQYVDSHHPEAGTRRLEVRREEGGLRVMLDGRTVPVEGGFTSPNVLQIRIDGRPLRVVTAATQEERLIAHGAGRYQLRREEEGAGRGRRQVRHDGHEHSELTATMPGQVLKVLVEESELVRKGQTLVIIEAMKMEHEVKAPRHGRVMRIACAAGAMVSPGVTLVEIEATEELT